MTARTGSTSIDGTPISDTDLARIEAEEHLHLEQQRGAARVVASASLDSDDARMLLDMLGLNTAVVSAALTELREVRTPLKRPRKRRAA